MLEAANIPVRPSDRSFVKFPCSDVQTEIRHISNHRDSDSQPPILSIVIPTVDGYRDGHFPRLLKQLRQQSFQDFETIIVKGDPRQGRAINTGAALAKGRYLLTLDDDTRLGHQDLLKTLVQVMDTRPDIGMAGVPNLIPANASRLVRLVMEQVPRRSSPMVEKITVSDMAEHPCLIMRKDLFYRIGGENEMLPRGLDPYLRQAFRDAGFNVVVVPEVYIHHMPPSTPIKLIRQFFRNGIMACYVNKFYPQWVYELTSEHHDLDRIHANWRQRISRQAKKLTRALVDLKLVFLTTQLAYISGFCWGVVRIRRVGEC